METRALTTETDALRLPFLRAEGEAGRLLALLVEAVGRRREQDVRVHRVRVECFRASSKRPSPRAASHENLDPDSDFRI